MGAYGKAMGVMSYGKDTYFVKIHTNPIYGNGMGAKVPYQSHMPCYGKTMGFLLWKSCWIKCEQQCTHRKSISENA